MKVGLRGLFVGTAATAAIAACFVDLDPPLGPAEPMAEAGTPSTPDVIVTEPADVVVDAPPPKAECTTASDCNPGDAPGVGCLAPSCVAGKCEYTLCGANGASCSLRTCNRAANTCNTPAMIPFAAGAFAIDLFAALDGVPSLQCSATSASPTRCFAAVYPYLFVAEAGSDPTANAYAYDVSDPTNQNPTGIPISGIDFLSSSVVASGRRVYFVDQSTISPRIAWVDVSSNPYVKTMTASSAAVTYATRPTTAFPAPNGGLYLFAPNAAGRFGPTSPTAVTLFPISNAAGAAVATDSTHLYFASNPTNGRLSQGAAVNLGTKSAALPTGLVDSGIGPLTAQVYFAGSSGSLLATAATTRDAGAEAGARLDQVALERFDGSATESFALETYGDASTTLKASGPLVAVDGGAVALAVHDETFTTFAKRIAFDSDAGGTTDLDASSTLFSDLTVLSSNGYVYVVHWHTHEKKVFVDVLAADCP